jgi:hypothetical protein
MQLYTKQQEFVNWFKALPTPQRAYLAAGVGTGKTPMALRAAQALGAKRILIVTLAMIRRHWARECEKWLGEPAWPIETGISTKLTKAASIQRDLAYGARIKVVSYDLLPQIAPETYDMVIIDEAHEIGTATSKQHRTVANFVKACPYATVLLLSATPMPTKVSQLWSQYNVIKPGWAGSARPKTGEAPWAFLARYSHIIRNDYGASEGLPNLEKMPELYARLAPMTYRITREDIAPEQAPLLVSTLEVPKLHDPVVDVEEWVNSITSNKLIVLPYYVDTATRLVAQLTKRHEVFMVHGGIPTAKRDSILQQAAASPKCILIATQDSVGVGVRFMWAEQALIVESRRNPGQVIQLLGRFQSVGSEARPKVEILCDPDSLDSAQILVKRAEAFNTLYRSGAAESVIKSVFATKPITDDDLFAMLGDYKETSNWEDDNDDT